MYKYQLKSHYKTIVFYLNSKTFNILEVNNRFYLGIIRNTNTHCREHKGH